MKFILSLVVLATCAVLITAQSSSSTGAAPSSTGARSSTGSAAGSSTGSGPAPTPTTGVTGTYCNLYPSPDSVYFQFSTNAANPPVVVKGATTIKYKQCANVTNLQAVDTRVDISVINTVSNAVVYPLSGVDTYKVLGSNTDLFALYQAESSPSSGSTSYRVVSPVNPTPIAAGKARITIGNLATGVGTVDVYIDSKRVTVQSGLSEGNYYPNDLETSSSMSSSKVEFFTYPAKYGTDVALATASIPSALSSQQNMLLVLTGGKTNQAYPLSVFYGGAAALVPTITVAITVFAAIVMMML